MQRMEDPEQQQQQPTGHSPKPRCREKALVAQQTMANLVVAERKIPEAGEVTEAKPAGGAVGGAGLAGHILRTV